jgi:preprotein translocase subunit YajC
MISEVYAMAPPQSGSEQKGGALTMFLPLIVIFAIFYFLIIRPQKKKEVEHRKFLDQLNKGDEVITQAGIYGRIAGIADTVITLDVPNQVKIKVLKSSIAGKANVPADKAA